MRATTMLAARVALTQRRNRQLLTQRRSVVGKRKPRRARPKSCTPLFVEDPFDEQDNAARSLQPEFLARLAVEALAIALAGPAAFADVRSRCVLTA